MNISFMSQDREVMRITSDGELIVHDASAAAKCLMREWQKLSRPSPIAEPQDSDAARDELAQTKPPAGQSEGFYARLRALVAAQRYQEALDLMRTPVLAAIADKDGHHG